MNVDATGIAADPPSRTVHPAGATVTETVTETVTTGWSAQCPRCGAWTALVDDRTTAIAAANACANHHLNTENT